MVLEGKDSIRVECMQESAPQSAPQGKGRREERAGGRRKGGEEGRRKGGGREEREEEGRREEREEEGRREEREGRREGGGRWKYTYICACLAVDV